MSVNWQKSMQIVFCNNGIVGILDMFAVFSESLTTACILASFLDLTHIVESTNVPSPLPHTHT